MAQKYEVLRDKNRKKSKCPSINEWINNLYLNKILVLGQKRNKILIHASTWMNVKIIMLQLKRLGIKMYSILSLRYKILNIWTKR